VWKFLVEGEGKLVRNSKTLRIELQDDDEYQNANAAASGGI
jgi:uncharacterized HAD superfamily protein